MNFIYTILIACSILLSFGGRAETSGVVNLPNNFNKLNSECRICSQLAKEREDFSVSKSENERIDIVMNVARIIKSMVDQRGVAPGLFSAIYYAIDVSLEVERSDFDRETIVWLLRLRQRYPVQFDNVLWRFPKAQQTLIVNRMKAVVERGLVKGGKVPVVREVE